jgi:hypothetical protein
MIDAPSVISGSNCRLPEEEFFADAFNSPR